MSSLVIQTSFIGDVILTTPLIRELAQRGPVDVITTKAGASILRSDPNIRNVFVFDKRGEHAGVKGFIAFTRHVRSKAQEKYSAAYLAQGSLRSAALAIAAGADRRIGFDTSSGKLLYTNKVTYQPTWHHSERLLSLFSGDTHRPDALHSRPHLFPTAADVEKVTRLLEEAGVGPDHEFTGEDKRPSSPPFIVLAPGSVWATKRWPYYSELAELIPSGMGIAIIGGPEDQDMASQITETLRRERGSEMGILNAVGRLSLLGSAELIRRARAIVTNDSSPQHLASAVGTPTVTIFGPTVPEFGFGPLAPVSIVAQHSELDCRPCDRHGPQKCPLGHWKCMIDTAPSQVLQQLNRVQQTTVDMRPPLPPVNLAGDFHDS